MRRDALVPVKSWLLALLLLVLPNRCARSAPQTGVPEEASGITRLGNDLLIVDDSKNGVYFRFRLPANPPQLIRIDPGQVERIPFPHGELAIDLESIGVLGDGRVAALSERLRALVGNDGLIAEYQPQLAEFGNRGLEGLAVERRADGSSRVAVLWEGGYPEYHLVQPPLRELVPRVPLRPFILVHDLKAGEAGVTIEMKDALRVIELDVPVPEAKEPEAQRFRAPDLVWYTWPHREKNETGFIVLLSSQNSAGARKYQYHWLQRFTGEGKPVGQPLDLDALVPAEFKGANWEGLGWFEEGKSLVVIHEKGPMPAVVALVVPLPDEWTQSQRPPGGPTHVILHDAEYYLTGPQQARPPDGTLPAGSKVTLLQNAGSYCLVRTEQNVEAYVVTDALKPLE
jgi:hypothetical protein